MKIKFYNLGAIKETELDLRPMTIIIGPNNSNKTYIAYCVYGLLQQGRKLRGSVLNFHPFEENSNTIFDVGDSFLSSINDNTNHVCMQFAENLQTFFQDSSQKVFAQTRFSMSYSAQEVISSLLQLNNRISPSYIDDDRQFRFSFSEGKMLLTPEPPTDIASTFAPYEAEIAFQVEFLRQIFPSTFLLPAERNAFIITYKMLLNKRFSLLRDRERELFSKYGNQDFHTRLLREQGDIRYPQPIEDFLDMLSDIELSHGKVAAPKTAHSNGQNGTGAKDNFADVARQIERYIQGGNQTAFRPTTLGGSELMVHVSKALSIDLYNASSSIKQLAPLLLYLRYRAAENDLLIIDEPEMNLHPESQVKLLEILAILVNAGVRVMLTTHSPYFMSHLNNLVVNEQHSDSVKKKQATSLYLKDPRAFLREDQVSAYEMRENEKHEHYLHSLKDAEFGIRYDTLSDVSVDVQQKYFEIAEKGRTTRRGKG